MIRRFLAPLVALFVVLLAPTVARAEGGVGYRVDGDPGSTIDGGFITLQASPGGFASGHFYATNGGSQPASITIYGADGLTGDTTGIVYSDAGDQLVDAGGWLSPSASGATLPAAGGDRRIDFSVRVPSGARAGDHVGGVVLEQRRAGAAISQIVRNVVPVLITVSGGASPSLSLRSALVSSLPGTSLPAVTVKMVNTGQRICRPLLTVSLVGQSERGSAVTRQLDAILPGDGVPYPLPWPRALDAGTYTASVSASGCGPTATLSTQVHSDVTAESNTPSANAGDQGGKDAVITKAAPSAPKYTAPNAHATDGGGTDSAHDHGSAPGTGAAGGGGGHAAPPTGAAGSASASAAAAAGAVGKLRIPKLSELGDVAIKYLPPVLERLIAPLSLLGLMLLFLFAQETFDRKDPKLALAPIHRDPDLEFLPLGDSAFLPESGRQAELEVVRSPSRPEPLTP